MGTDESTILRARGIRYGFDAAADFLGPVNLDLKAGTFAAIVGPNGAGKSTLMRLLAGLRKPRAGLIHLADRAIEQMRPIERARLLAFLPQRPLAPLSATVEEIVRLGRFPHRPLRLFESAGDLAVVRSVMEETQTAGLSHRTMETLSGGEAQRVHLAAALAQRPRVLMLDEPTADLDVHHQIAIFAALRDWARNNGLAVLAVTHDLNLASRFCDDVTLLDTGKVVAQGPPADVLTPATLEPVYRVTFISTRQPGIPQPLLVAWDVTAPADGRPSS